MKEEGSHVNVKTGVYNPGIITLSNRQGKAKGVFEDFGLKVRVIESVTPCCCVYGYKSERVSVSVLF